MPISLLASTTTALDAITVPPVIPSIVSNSASLITAEPIVNPVAVTTPEDVIAPEDIVPIPEIFVLESRTRALDAAAVPAVIPSIVSNSASVITAEPTVNPLPVTTPEDVIAPEASVPATVAFAPLKVRAVVVPDFTIRLPELLLAEPNVVPASLKKISPPSASNTISVVASNVMVELESISAIIGVVKVTCEPEIPSPLVRSLPSPRRL